MSLHTFREVQARLNALGYDAGPVDGAFGGRSTKALARFQAAAGLDPDGVYGGFTDKALFRSDAPFVGGVLRDTLMKARIGDAPRSNPRYTWPRQSEMVSVFGPPAGPRCTAGKCVLPFPFRLDWSRGETVRSFSCHEAVAKAFTELFAAAADAIGDDTMRELGLDLFGGCYNPRKMRGGTSWSMHAWGVAVDLDPDRNALAMHKPEAAFSGADYEQWWDIVESFGMTSLGRSRDFDWMHLQAARLG